jgi:hypothetical protein
LPTGAIQNPQLRQHVFNQGTGHTRGTIDYPKPFAKFSGMAGQLVWEKLMRYAPIEDIARCEKCAKLFIIAERRVSLFGLRDHQIRARPGIFVVPADAEKLSIPRDSIIPNDPSHRYLYVPVSPTLKVNFSFPNHTTESVDGEYYVAPECTNSPTNPPPTKGTFPCRCCCP